MCALPSHYTDHPTSSSHPARRPSARPARPGARQPPATVHRWSRAPGLSGADRSGPVAPTGPLSRSSHFSREPASPAEAGRLRCPDDRRQSRLAGFFTPRETPRPSDMGAAARGPPRGEPGWRRIVGCRPGGVDQQKRTAKTFPFLNRRKLAFLTVWAQCPFKLYSKMGLRTDKLYPLKITLK